MSSILKSAAREATGFRGYLAALAWAIGGTLLGAALILGGGDRTAARPADARLVVAPAAGVAASPSLRTKSIENVRLGDRVAGRNPIREQVEAVTPDPATWRAIGLRMDKGGGRSLRVDLLRPLAWIEATEAEPGKAIRLDLPEMGAVGDAIVTHIAPCPEIEPGDGQVVTGTFVHQADENSNVVELRLEGLAEVTGVTANHPYWSADRREFVKVGDLREGEGVDTEFGVRRVVSVSPAEYGDVLYNIETTEHVYRVGSLGTLVHNSCVDRALAAAQRHGGTALDAVNHIRFPNRQAARMAASEIAGDMGSGTRAIRLIEFRGAPSRISGSNRVIGRESADGSIYWRDDFLGHPRFGAGPHVNVGVGGEEFHLWY